MPVVLDANLLVVLVSGDARRETVSEHITRWLTQGVALHAPSLLPYEVANALIRAIVAGQFSRSDLEPALAALGQLPIAYHPLIPNPRTIEIALALRRQSAYDAAYIALAESLGAELWTLDGSLYRNARNLGFSVQLIPAVPQS